jgi:hypothetical protein
MPFLKIILPFVLLIFSHASIAADDIPPPSLNKAETNFTQQNKTESVPTIPDDEADDSRNIPEPEVRIIRKKDTVIEEYRVNGRIRFVKITPSSGSPYYMVDTDGDGILETRDDNFTNPPINQWILLEW